MKLFVTRRTNNGANSRMSWLSLLAIALLPLMLAEPALAQTVGGGTGGASLGRLSAILGELNVWLYSIGGVLFAGALLYSLYALVFGGKEWKDISKIVIAMAVAGLVPTLVAWFWG